MNKKRIEKVFISFLRELDILLSNGFDILNAIELYQRSTPEIEAQNILQGVIQKIRSGESITSSLFESEFRALPSFYRMVFISAEKSGTFHAATAELYSFMKKKAAFENHLKRMIIYPSITIGVAAAALFVVIFHFLPSLSFIYSNMDVELPLITQIFITIGEKFSSISFLILLLLLFTLATFSFFPFWKKNLIYKIKPIASFFRWFRCYYISFHLHMLSRSGMDIISSLDVMAEKGSKYGSSFNDILKDIRNGDDPVSSFKKNTDLPGSFYETFALGFNSGNAGQAFKYLFESASEKLTHNIAFMVSFLEPFMIIVTAVIVGGIVFLGLYPLLTISDHIKIF